MLHKSQIEPERRTRMLTSAGETRFRSGWGAQAVVGTGSSGSNVERMQKDEDKEGREREDEGNRNSNFV